MNRKILFATASAIALGFNASPAGAEGNPQRDAYFGETHVHTGWSLDAWLFGNRMTDPGDAYAYFKGQSIKHPLGYDIKIDTPLDFAGVTDHSEYVGVIKLANDPTSPISNAPAAASLIMKNNSPEEVQRVFVYATKLLGGPPVPALTSPEIARTVWDQTVQLAEKANQPGKFTAFCSYEWTSMPNNMNLHRNVFFKDCKHVPDMPFTALSSSDPGDLWKWMDTQRASGNELLAISHNANLSDGRMYPTDVDIKGRPIDKAYAESRMRNEPLIELKQIKGQSETHPLLSPTDEFANYEIFSQLLGDPQGRTPHIVGSYARQALKDGIALQDSSGFNPYRFGFGAAADSHNTGVSYREDTFFGGHGVVDGKIETRMAGQLFAGIDPRLEGTAGLTGVWAEENTRESIFNAMQRKETFAVSGPHIKVRLFGGWTYPATADALVAGAGNVVPDWMKDPGWIAIAYQQGVPMGGDLTPLQAGQTAPAFAVWAIKDPTSANLDRIQIIKGWTDSGQSFEKVFDIAWAGGRRPDPWTRQIGAIENTVDTVKATYSNSVGAVELKTVWTDPEFDPSHPAFYYARVLEIPTPRWTTIQAAKLGIAPPDVVAATIQERAWSSPIWYTPTEDARKLAEPSQTVAALVKAGATPLDDAALKSLVVGKSPWLQNNVTGSKFQMVFNQSGPTGSSHALVPSNPAFVTSQFADNQGQFEVDHAGRSQLQPSLTGDAAARSYIGAHAPYYINGGKIVTELGGTPITITVYKVGAKYIATRSNEFGYANYELIPDVPELNPLGPGKLQLH